MRPARRSFDKAFTTQITLENKPKKASNKPGFI
ncbi:MAG: hypothetical protein ACI934_000044 [Pseudohongiellaceae bacterium]|jgi:hypothetical protein